MEQRQSEKQECGTHNKKAKSNIFQCKVCPYNTLRKPFLDKHMQQKHGFSMVKADSSAPCKRQQGDIETNIKRKRIQPSSSESNVGDNLEFGCEMCDFKTRHDVLLNIHMETHETDEGEMYQCTHCDFTTVEISDLRAHEGTHKKLELFKCPKCDYASRHKCNFKTHLKIHEGPSVQEKYTCKFCTEFSSFHKSSLYKHISLKHNDCQQIYECEKCSYVTPYKSQLTSHQNVHIDPADLPIHHCEICEFETRNEVTMRKHVNKHKKREEKGEELIIKEVDGVTQTVWFCCNLCEFRARDQRYVILHRKVHARVDEINRKGAEIVFGKGKEPENVASHEDANR